VSDALGLVVAAAAAATSPSTPAALPPSLNASSQILHHDISIAVPSIDGLRGLAVTYERWFPASRISVGVSGQLRQSAAGDFTGITSGVGGELRWYWRASAWRSSQPAGSMVGWFVGGRIDVAVGATRDDDDDRWLGTALSLSGTGHVGYRVAPWRGLELTPTAGLLLRRELDVSGRLPGWTRAGISVGLTVGWMF
jgi:hypothetical protein